VAAARGAPRTGVTDELRVLLVGAGRAGLVHGRNFAACVRGARLAGIADPDEGAVRRAAAELGCEQTFTDAPAALADEAFDAVVIASPTFTHAELAVAALTAGKHVLCEKPLAASLEEAAEVAAAVEETGRVFVMGFMRRFDAGFVRAAERIAAGEIGRPLLVRSTGRGPGLPPEWALDVAASGGLIAEVNSHDLDTIRWLSEQEFASVHALGRAAKRPDIAARYPGFVDLVVATFELDGGALAQLDGACPADYGYDARVEVYGTEGVVFAGDPLAHPTRVVRREGASADPVASWRTVFADAYRAEDAHFAAACRGEEEPRTSVEDGVRALEAVVAVNRSLAEGRPVSLDEARVA
jgi:myo-inositol 2-dehydrogenase/D-chiro-inositol 1-dehydrogenase/scyllo-inositol 2-dehydrogenase (NAD+)